MTKQFSSERTLLLERYVSLKKTYRDIGMFSSVSFFKSSEFRKLSVTEMHREINRAVTRMNTPK